MSGEVILEVKDLVTRYTVKRGGRKVEIPAVDGVSFSLNKGEILGIVGESGCGKTTVGRTIMRLARASSGAVLFKGRDVLSAEGRDLADLRLNIRMVFQDPQASLNPKRTIAASIAEAGDINKAFASREEREGKIVEGLNAVGLAPSYATSYPHELSGGQRQRAGIARAILPVPELVIADEPVSALDVSVQAQVLNLLMDLRRDLNLAMIFISHDIGVIGHLSDRVAVMYMGKIVELADARAILEAPRHPYTRALMAAVPKIDGSARISGAIAEGEPVSQFGVRQGCLYAARCPLAEARCQTSVPPLRAAAGTQAHDLACHVVA